MTRPATAPSHASVESELVEWARAALEAPAISATQALRPLLDSLAAVELAVLLRERYLRVVPNAAILEAVLAAGTLEELAETTTTLAGTQPGVIGHDLATSPAAEGAAGDVALPLLPEQAWFLAEAMPQLVDPEHWNNSQLFRLPADTSTDEVATAVAVVWRRHGALRARVLRGDGGWRQVVAGDAELPFAYHETAGDRSANEFGDLCLAAEGSLSITDGPLARFTHVRTRDENLLLFTAHHLVSDWVSQEIVRRELTTLLLHPEQPVAHDGSGSYERWCAQVASLAHGPELAAQAPYWAALPWADYRRVPVDPRGGSPTERSVSAPVDELTARWRAPLPRLLVAAVGVAARRVLGGPVVVGNVHNGRTLFGSVSPDAARTVGRLAIVAGVPFGPLAASGSDVAAALAEVDAVPDGGTGAAFLRWMSRPDLFPSEPGGGLPSGISLNFFGRHGGSPGPLPHVDYPYRIGGENAAVHPIEVVGGVAAGRLELGVIGKGGVEPELVAEFAGDLARSLGAA